MFALSIIRKSSCHAEVASVRLCPTSRIVEQDESYRGRLIAWITPTVARSLLQDHVTRMESDFTVVERANWMSADHEAHVGGRCGVHAGIVGLEGLSKTREARCELGPDRRQISAGFGRPA